MTRAGEIVGTPSFATWTVVTIYDGFTAAGKPKQIVNVYAEADENAARRTKRQIEKRWLWEGEPDSRLVVKVRRAWLLENPS